MRILVCFYICKPLSLLIYNLALVELHRETEVLEHKGKAVLNKPVYPVVRGVYSWGVYTPQYTPQAWLYCHILCWLILVFQCAFFESVSSKFSWEKLQDYFHGAISILIFLPQKLLIKTEDSNLKWTLNSSDLDSIEYLSNSKLT